MAWFGGNLKNLTENLTGQLSNVATSAASFTRDVIAEGTEEVADQSTELQISEDRIRRLETAIIALRAENERLGTINAELEEKAEASELQINSISSQYRSVLVEKEDQLNSLIQKQNDMQQTLHHDILSTGPHGGMTAATSTSSLSGSAIMADSHDFDDVIWSQQEINRLSSEMGRVRAECNHWKEMAAGKQNGDKPVFQIGEDASQGETAELKAKIKSLEEKLRHEVDESQHELSALQDSHSHKLKTLSKKHKTDVEDYERRIESLEKMVGFGQKSSDTGIDDGNDLQKRIMELEGLLHETRQQVGQLEESNYQLGKENTRLTESDRDNTRLVQTLRRKVDVLEKDRTRLEREVKEQSSSGDGEVANLQKEKDELRLEVEHLMKVVNRQETELEVLLGSHEQVREELFATKQRLLTELNASHASTSAMLEDIHNAGRKFSTDEALRKSKLLKEKQEIVDKMITAGQKMSESKSAVATLEAATLDISDQAAEIVSEIGCSQHQEITADFVSSLEKENDLLKHHVSRLQDEIDELNQSCEVLADDKQKCETVITNLNSKVKELTGHDPQGSADQRPSDPSQSESEVTLVTGESDLDSLPHGGAEDGAQVRRHILYRRPQSPTDSSVASDLSSSMREGWTSETELSSDGGFLAEGKQSLLENSDAVSFDGEFDDSIMFAGIKEKFPEAAVAFKQQLNQFEMVRADWEMEKQALEEVVIRMRDQLKERDRIIQDMTAEKGLMAVRKEHSEDMEERVKTLQDNNASLLREKETAERVKEEMAEKLRRIEEEKSDLDTSISEITKAKDNLESKLHEAESRYSAIETDLETSRGDVEEELSRTRDEKEQLETDLHQLDAQHQTALEQIIASRDNLIQEIKEKEAKITEVNDKLVRQSAEIEQSTAEKSGLESEMEDMREDLSTSRADLLDSEQMKQEQDVAMTTLRTKLQTMQDEHNELLKEFDEFKRESNLNASQVKASKQEVEMQKQVDETDLPSRKALQMQILELTDKLQSLQSKEQSEASPNESVAYLEHELSRTHHEIEELNKSIDERDVKLQEMSSHHIEHSKLVEQKDAEVAVLKTEIERLQEEVKSRDEVLTKSHIELMKLQADLAAIKSGTERRETAQEQERTVAEQMQKTCDELKADLNSKKELLESTIETKKELEELIEQKEEDVRALADENSHYFKNVEKSKDKISELSAKVKEMENVELQLQETRKNFIELTAELEEAKLELSKKSSTEVEHLETIHHLEEEVNDIKKDPMLEHTEPAEIEKDSPQTTEDKLSEELNVSTKKISELNEELQTAELELSAVKIELESVKQTVATQDTQLSESNERISEKETEIGQLRGQIESMRDQLSASETNISAVEQYQKDINDKSAIISELQQELEVRRAELDHQLQTLQESIQTKDSEISQLDSSLTQLRSEKESLDDSLVKYENQIEDLQRTNQQKDGVANRLREEVRNITTQLQQPAEHPLQNGERIEDTLSSPSSPFSKSPSGVFQGQDGSISDNEKHYEKIIQERDKEISMLQHERQSLLTSLDEKSTSTMGNSVLVDLHKSQMKVKTLESERHQMMTVLNEKTREASNLKNEVHKLLKVISAQKSALEKAQEDVKELHSASRGPRDDMQKEALQNLSRIIQDKDLEIEALKQKNTSLLEVLQSEAPSNSSQISGVLSESEKLQKENTVLKEERDQLVVSIHQKHQESLAYYEEVQRLVGIVGGEVQKYNNLQQQHGTLQTQMDELTESMNQSKLELNESCRMKGSLEEDLEIQKQLVEELENQLQLLDDSRTELTTRMEELENIEATKANELVEKESELSHLQRTIENLRTTPEPIIEETLVKAEMAEMAPVQLSAPPMQYEQKLQEKDAEIADLRTQLQSQQVAPQDSEDVVKLNEHDNELANVREQLESQGHALLQMDGLVKDRSTELEKRKLEIATVRQQIDQQDQAILDQNTTLQKQSSDLQQLHQDLKAKTEEAHSLRQHTQQISMRLQAVEQELGKAQQEIINHQHMVHNKDGELRQLQDLMSRMSAEVRERDFEMTGLQDKCKTLTKLVDEKETDVQGEVRRLLGEAEAMQTQAQRFQQERDQAMLALEKCQRDLLLLQEEASMRGGSEQKLRRELDRLRDHLIQMEDSYTQEALQSEEREKELRNRLSTAEEHAHSSSTAVQSASKEASVQIESLRDQLNSMAEQKDQALMQMAMVQSESEEYILSLNNLQMVLEQFQQEKEASISAEVEVYQLKAREKERIAADLLKQNVELQERVASVQDALDVASRLSEQLDKREEAMERLRADMHKKDEILEEFQRRFEEVSSSSETKVDKPLVKNLFMNYLSAPPAKKQEMVKVISNVLNFSEEDLHKVGLGSGGGGWLSGFFRRSPHPTPPATPTKANTSFSQQFVQFLESESTPKRSPRLPVDEMSQDRHHAYNPFSAPVPQHSPFIQPGTPGGAVGTPKGPGAAHPFLKATGQPATPLGAVQPVIASAGMSAGNPLGAAAHSLPTMPTFTPVPAREGATPGRGSPRGQAAVLGDILQ